MSSIELGTLERVDPRTAWANEQFDFTPWLRDHAPLLGEALGLELDVEVRNEVAVGPFSADLVGTDAATGARVLIENQLEQTDHAHLGQLLTYAGGLEADILIWVAPRIREEHRQALTWLNEKTREGTSFFGVEVELLRIDASRPAPHFRVVVEPNEWQKAASQATPARTSERGERYRGFWRDLLADLWRLDPHATTASPDRVPPQNWYGISIGRSGFQDNFVFGYDGPNQVVRIELYIDVADQAQNKAIFDLLESEREEIEAALGEPVRWERRDDIRASRIFATRPGSIDDEDALDELRRWGAERMIKIRDVFGPRVRRLSLPLAVAASSASVPVDDEATS